MKEVNVIEEKVKEKNIDKRKIAKRAIAAILSSSLANMYYTTGYSVAITNFIKIRDKFNIGPILSNKEKHIFTGSATPEDVFDVSLECEYAYALLWVLGLIKRLEYPSEMCDYKNMFSVLHSYDSIESIVNKCNIRPIDDILDMENSYHIYDNIIETTEIKDLHVYAVKERKKALDWVLDNDE